MIASPLFEDLKRDLMSDTVDAGITLLDEDDAEPLAALSIRVDDINVMLVPGEENAMLCADCGEIAEGQDARATRIALDLNLALYRDLGATLCTNPITRHLLLLDRVVLKDATARNVVARARTLAVGVKRYAKDRFAE